LIRKYIGGNREMDFSHSVINQVWEKATPIQGVDPAQKRKDKCGSVIAKASYGMQTSFGWEIDHINPISNGGSNNITIYSLCIGKTTEAKLMDRTDQVNIVLREIRINTY